MLFPLITKLATTGSIVHSVPTTSGHSHLTNGMNLRSWPSTTSSYPSPLLNLPSTVDVNESAHGTPLCLKTVDKSSPPDKSGNLPAISVLSTFTSSSALVLLSLSCLAWPTLTLDLVTVGFVSSNDHVVYIVFTDTFVLSRRSGVGHDPEHQYNTLLLRTGTGVCACTRA